MEQAVAKMDVLERIKRGPLWALPSQVRACALWARRPDSRVRYIHFLPPSQLDNLFAIGAMDCSTFSRNYKALLFATDAA